NGRPAFLILDAVRDCEVDGLPLVPGSEILASRRRYRELWIPSVQCEFAAHLARTMARGTLDEKRSRRLSELYRPCPSGCALELQRLWRPRDRELLLRAAGSG